MANEDIDLKQEQIKKSMQNNDLIKVVIINIILTTILCIIFIGANFIIQTNLLNAKLATLNSQSEEAVADENVTEEIKHGVVVDLGDFILNLADEGERHYLKTNVALEISKSELLTILSSNSYS